MTPETFTFNGNVTTFFGLIGVSSTLLILVVVFRRYFNSPHNIRYVKPGKDLDHFDSIFTDETKSS